MNIINAWIKHCKHRNRKNTSWPTSWPCLFKVNRSSLVWYFNAHLQSQKKDSWNFFYTDLHFVHFVFVKLLDWHFPYFKISDAHFKKKSTLYLKSVIFYLPSTFKFKMWTNCHTLLRSNVNRYLLFSRIKQSRAFFFTNILRYAV